MATLLLSGNLPEPLFHPVLVETLPIGVLVDAALLGSPLVVGSPLGVDLESDRCTLVLQRVGRRRLPPHLLVLCVKLDPLSGSVLAD